MFWTLKIQAFLFLVNFDATGVLFELTWARYEWRDRNISNSPWLDMKQGCFTDFTSVTCFKARAQEEKEQSQPEMEALTHYNKCFSQPSADEIIS